jgi:hypothetical protein
MFLVLPQVYGAQNILSRIRMLHHINVYISGLLKMIVLLYTNLQEYQIPFYTIHFNGKALLYARFYFLATYANSAFTSNVMSSNSAHARCT